eukprot:gb/GEZN01016079.1/.p1 GENE.gb/GEZN01016079.1/~~gb/GEZN01016079.1/.p1  ORF type:complete len:266 (-),score=30.65 gb/GEZN01016079.1/:67-768(-)
MSGSCSLWSRSLRGYMATTKWHLIRSNSICRVYNCAGRIMFSEPWRTVSLFGQAILPTYHWLPGTTDCRDPPFLCLHGVCKKCGARSDRLPDGGTPELSMPLPISKNAFCSETRTVAVPRAGHGTTPPPLALDHPPALLMLAQEKKLLAGGILVTDENFRFPVKCDCLAYKHELQLIPLPPQISDSDEDLDATQLVGALDDEAEEVEEIEEVEEEIEDEDDDGTIYILSDDDN